MGKVYFSMLFLFVVTFGLAQTTVKVEVDERLYEAYDKNYLDNLQTANPFLLKRWNFYLDHAWYITEYPSEKGSPAYPEVQLTDLKTINILQLEKEQRHLHRDFYKRMKYKIAGTNKVLVYYSGKEFNTRLREELY